MHIRDVLLKDLTRDQMSRARACQNGDELLRLAREEGVELSAEQLEAVNGGGCSKTTEPCPKCGSTNIKKEHRGNDVHMHTVFICKNCKHEWDPD